MRKGIDYIGVAVVPILHDGNGKYLFGFRSKGCRDEQERWDALGPGGLKYGETIEDGIVREVKEETGATPFDLEFLGIRETFRNSEGQTKHWISIDYRAQVEPEKVFLAEPEKFSELRWCAIDEIPEPQHSQLPVFIQKYASRLSAKN